MNAQPCEYTENRWDLYIQRVNFMACELHFNKAVVKTVNKTRGASCDT